MSGAPADLEGDELTVLAEVARDLASRTSEQAILDRVAELAQQLLTGCDEAGIMLLTRRRQVETVAATGQGVRDSDDAQAELGEGPCFDAALQRHDRNQVFRCEDTHTETRWEAYLPRARELGVGSMLGFQLFHHEQTFGALNLYSNDRDAFDVDSERRGWILASHAAVAFTAARSNAQLHIALQGSRTIGQAIGMVRGRFGMSEDQAWATLQRLSQNSNTKLRDLAEAVVSTGRLPD